MSKSSNQLKKIKSPLKDEPGLDLKSSQDHTATKLQRQNDILVKLEKKEKGKRKK